MFFIYFSVEPSLQDYTQCPDFINEQRKLLETYNSQPNHPVRNMLDNHRSSTVRNPSSLVFKGIYNKKKNLKYEF